MYLIVKSRKAPLKEILIVAKLKIYLTSFRTSIHLSFMNMPLNKIHRCLHEAKDIAAHMCDYFE